MQTYIRFRLSKAAYIAFLSLGLIAHAQKAVENFYSPATDLESIDVRELDKATKSIDISTYSLTDVKIAEELEKKAIQGVHVRIYRDNRQYKGELGHQNNAMALFNGNKNIEVRVKHSSVLAHLKAYVVDYGQPNQELREGSANWSPSGEQKQDNSLIIIRDKDAIDSFERNFNIIWTRADNQIVQ